MTPESEQELAEAVQDAKGPLRVLGGGTRDVGRPVEGAELCTAGLSGVALYEPGALTLVVGAGTPLARVEEVLAGEGQRLAFEPMDHRRLLGSAGTPTIGGVVAGNISGPRRVQVGAARDFLLGVRFVDGSGQVLQNGGRVMKNVTGYDLVKLLAGSWGTLGVLSQVSLKVLAIPEAEVTLVAGGMDAAAGQAVLARALGSPFEVSGAAHLGGETLLRIEGLEASVRYRADALRAHLGGDWQLVEGEASAARWRDLRDVAPLARAPVVWRLSVKPSEAPLIAAALDDRGLAHEALYDWGGGLMWIAPDAACEDGGAALIRAEIAARGGHARLEKAPVALRRQIAVFQPQSPLVTRLSAEIKHKFDPWGVLNPGLMGA
ncbi:MAG TPA: FAD-binding protein [Aliiroseovarius sp.]|nr:FAD-binding protein [Aliiroseovarius sp.]